MLFWMKDVSYGSMQHRRNLLPSEVHAQWRGRPGLQLNCHLSCMLQADKDCVLTCADDNYVQWLFLGSHLDVWWWEVKGSIPY